MKNNSNSYSKSFRLKKESRSRRIKSVQKRNSVLSLVTSFVDSKYPKKQITQRKIFEDSVVFQVFGIIMLTFGIVLAFQAFIKNSEVETNAEQENQKHIRILTNFRYQPESATQNSRLQDIVTSSPAQEDPISKPQLPEAQPKSVEYIVQNGDSLYSISADHRISVESIITSNSLQEPYQLKVGQTLTLNK